MPKNRVLNLFVVSILLLGLLPFPAAAVPADPPALAAGGGPQSAPTSHVYHSTDVSKAISDHATITSVIDVPQDGKVVDVNVTLDASHTYDSDLDIYLLSPAGTRVELSTDNGGSGDNYTDTTFDDEATTSITGGSAPFTGSYQPEGALSDIDGERPGGTWTLEITDDASDDVGTLNAWSLTLALAAKVQVLPAVQREATCPEGDISYTLTLSNTSGFTDTFDIGLDGGLWPTVIDSTSAYLAHNQEATIVVTVSVPSYAFPGQVDVATVAITGQTYLTLTDQAAVETVAGAAWFAQQQGGGAALWAASANGGTALYYVDGLDASGSATDRVQIYAPDSGWSIGTSDGDARYGQVAGYSSAGGQIYVAGGFGSGWSPTSTLQSYDPGADAWASLSPMPQALGLGAGGVTADGTTFVWAGGSPSAGFLSHTPVYTYDIGTDTWYTGTTLTDVGFAASGYAMSGDQLYVAGNYFGEAAFYVYDVSDDAWTQLSDLPADAGRVSPLLIPAGSDLYLVGGGTTPAAASAKTFVYDLAGGAWAPFVDLNQATLGSGGGYLGGMLYTFGGGASSTAANSLAPHEGSLPLCPEWTTVELTGQVTDGTTGDPIAGAMVEALGTGPSAGPLGTTGAAIEGDPTPVAYTDASGIYTLTLVSATYEVIASYGAYDAKTESVSAGSSGATQDFVLGPPVSNPAPTTYSATLLWGEREVQTMTLANDGYSVLDFALTELDGAESSGVARREPKVIAQVPRQEPGELGSLSVDPAFVAPTPVRVEHHDAILQDNVLIDPGFENGPPPASGWTEWTNTGGEWILDPSSAWGLPAYAGTYVYWAGGYFGGSPSSDYVEQQVTLGGACTLSFNALYYRPDADDASPDIFYVAVDGTPVWTKAMVQANDTYPNWMMEGPIDLGTFGNELTTVRIGANAGGTSGSSGNVLVDQVLLECTGDIPWLSEDPITGTVDCQSDIPVELTFDASAVAGPGIYTGTLILASDDPANPEIAMPITLTVTDNANAGQIQGTVASDRPGDPIEGATVLLEAASGFTATLTTDAAGYYERRIPPGDLGAITVTVSAPGYLDNVGNTTVTAPGPTVYDVGLVYTGPDMVVEPGSIAETVVWGEAVTVTMVISNLGQTDLDFEIDDYAVLYLEDFEGDDGGYTVEQEGAGAPSWAWGEPATGPGAAHSGLNVWATNLSGAYNNSEFSYLVSPAIDLGDYAGGDVCVDWWEYADVEPGWDAWIVQASNDGGQNWSTIWGWKTGSTGGWVNPQVCLGPTYAVSDFRIRFGLSSDSTVTYPGYYVDDVRITADPPWQWESSNAGTVVSDTHHAISITLDSQYVPGPGVYTAVEDVTGNDLLNPRAIVPVTFTVTDNPDKGYLSGTVLGSRTADGMDMPLEGALVEVYDGDTYSTYTGGSGFYEFFFLPWLTGTYTIEVSYDGYVPYSGTVEILNGVSTTRDVTLIFDSPYLNANPESITETLTWGETVTHTLTVSNPLPANEWLYADLVELAGSYTPPVVQTVQVRVPAVESPPTLAAGVQALVPFAARGERTIDVELNKLALSTIKVLIVSAEVGHGNSLDGLDTMLAAFPDLEVDVHPLDAAPTLAELLPYHVVFIGNNNEWPIDNEALGDTLADYVDAGGKVILAQASMCLIDGAKFELGGRWEAEAYSPLTYSDVVLNSTVSLGIYQAGHPVMDGVNAITDNAAHGVGHMLQSKAEAVAYWDDGEIYVAARPDVVAFNQLLTNSNDWAGDVDTLLHNAILFLVPADVPWLDASVTGFALDVGQSDTSVVTLDAAAVDQPGTYSAWLWFNHNDSLQQGAYIPVEIKVEMDPGMGQLVGTVTMDRQAAGEHLPAPDATVTLSSSIGIVNLTAGADGDFVYYYDAADLPLDIQVTASYPGCQDDEMWVALVSGETFTAALEVNLLAPWIDTAPTALDVTVYAGEVATETLHIDNFGLADLEIPTILEIPAGSPLAGASQVRTNATWVDTPFAIDTQVAQDLTSKGESDVFIWLRERADLSFAYRIVDEDLRRQFVYGALTRIAERSQAGILSYLEAQGLDYQSFWINNSILVRGADQTLIDAMRGRGDVARIRGVYSQMHIPDPEELAIVTVHGSAADPTWNIDIVDAPDAWEQLNVTGEGVVVANIDTGVRYTHDALVDSYRGNLGGGVFDHNYNWSAPTADAQNPAQCGTAFDSALEPCDSDGHGTHTMGTMIGGDGVGPFDMDIGVAPGAKWMACMGCDGYYPGGPDECSDAALIGCAQWVVAPTDLNDQHPDPTMAPDVVNNSWGGGGADDWYYSYVEAWNAANIIPVFSAGNDGSGCNTLGSPGSYDNVIGVGGTDSADNNYAASSRGPGLGTGVFAVQKPDIAAPGEQVQSSVHTGDGDYATYSGTSMAAPHVAGLVALLRSVNPILDRQMVWDLLTQNAVTDTLNIKNGSWCGAGPGFPNYVFGYGRIDALASVQAALNGLDISWVSLNPISGTVQPAGASLSASVVFDSAGLETGVYTGTLRVLHNDPFVGQIDIPITMTVVEEPVDGDTKIYLPLVLRNLQ